MGLDIVEFVTGVEDAVGVRIPDEDAAAIGQPGQGFYGNSPNQCLRNTFTAWTLPPSTGSRLSICPILPQFTPNLPHRPGHFPEHSKGLSKLPDTR